MRLRPRPFRDRLVLPQPVSAPPAAHQAHTVNPADAGPLCLSECAACSAMFRDGPEQAGVCARCGHENYYTDEAP